MHNLKCIDNKELPLHGAMVSLTLINEKKTNIIIVGDSGAGKSESLEALKNILDDDISEMVTVFDDMGVVSKDLIAYGTETGAFVRMDDLDNGYAYQEIDRAILMNPDKKNARTIIPISSLDDIIKGHNVDIILYANNYSDKEGIKVFNDYKEALNVFKEGKRKAKATTSEEGIVTSYFANPFGPVQRQEEVDILLEKYFKEFSDRGIIIGELYTRLGILNEEKSGPLGAARALVKFIK
jgi:energy-coupling factor transporter ATP-binding protein EcfA2